MGDVAFWVTAAAEAGALREPRQSHSISVMHLTALVQVI